MPPFDASSLESPESKIRYLRGIVRPVEKIHPVEKALADAPDHTPTAIHQTKLLDDGTCITLLEVRGELARLRRLLENQSSVLEYALAGEQDIFVYLQTEPHDLGRFLLGVQTEADVVVEMPLRHTGDGGVRATLIGTDGAFQRTADALPDEFELEIEGIGDYRPGANRLFSRLTDRQHEILGTAIRAGYYDHPRHASQRDIAEHLEIAPGTVSQHLQRIEAKVFSAYSLDGRPSSGT